MKKHYHLKIDFHGRNEPLNLSCELEREDMITSQAYGVHDLNQCRQHGKLYVCGSCGMSTSMHDQKFRIILGNRMTRQAPFVTCAEYSAFAVMNS